MRATVDRVLARRWPKRPLVLVLALCHPVRALASSVAICALLAVAPGAAAQEPPAWLQRVEAWIKADGQAPRPASAEPTRRPSSPETQPPLAWPQAPVAAADRGGAPAAGGALLDRLEQELTGRLPSAVQAPAPAQQAGSKRFFKYVDRDGKEVFTNIVETVPVAQRKEAELDLSHVPLNSALGAEINARLDAEHAKLVETDYCAEVRRQAEAQTPQTIWDDYGPLIVCAIVALLFLIATPSMLRKVDAPAWARALSFAVPALAVVGFVTYSMVHTNRNISAFKRAAKPCLSSTFTNLGSAANPLNAKLKLVQHLKSQISMLDQISVSGGVQKEDRGL